MFSGVDGNEWGDFRNCLGTFIGKLILVNCVEVARNALCVA